MNKETKAVIISASILLVGAVFLQFGFIPIGATLMGIGGFGMIFGAPLVRIEK